MLIGGLWHGANIRFIIWGGIHGVSLAIHKLWVSIFPEPKVSSASWKRFLAGFITFQVVCLSWVFFRASDLDKATEMLGQIFSRFGFISVLSIITSQLNIYGLIALAFAIHWLPVSFKESYRGMFINTALPAKIAATLLIVFVIFQFKTSEIQPFIYFRF